METKTETTLAIEAVESCLSDIETLLSRLGDEIPTRDSLMDEIDWPSTSGYPVDASAIVSDDADTDSIARAIVGNFDEDTTITDAVDAALGDLNLGVDEYALASEVESAIQSYTEDVDLPWNTGEEAGSLVEQIANEKLMELRDLIGRLTEGATDDGPTQQEAAEAARAETERVVATLQDPSEPGALENDERRYDVNPEEPVEDPFVQPVTTLGHVRAVIPAEDMKLVLVAIDAHDTRIAQQNAVSMYVVDEG